MLNKDNEHAVQYREDCVQWFYSDCSTAWGWAVSVLIIAIVWLKSVELFDLDNQLYKIHLQGKKKKKKKKIYMRLKLIVVGICLIIHTLPF